MSAASPTGTVPPRASCRDSEAGHEAERGLDALACIYERAISRYREARNIEQEDGTITEVSAKE